MNVHQPIGITVDQHWCDDPHPARHHDNLHRSGTEAVHQGLIELIALLQNPVIENFAGNAKPLGPQLCSAARVVDHKDPDLCCQGPGIDRLHKGLEVASVPRRHNPDAQWCLSGWVLLARV